MSDPDTPDSQLPELRASDAEREETVEVLRRAAADGRLDVEELDERLGAVYTVRTRRELELLIADVSIAPLAADGTLMDPDKRGGLTVKRGPGGDRWVISIMSGHDKRGRWRLAPRCTVVNVLGGSEIDLNDAELSDPVTEINMYSFMGGATIRVPHGVEVHVSNFALMGGNGVKLGDEVTPPGAPVIRIRLVSIMAGAEVTRGRKPTRAERKRERELRKADQRELDP
jgi:hypothetical protein